MSSHAVNGIKFNLGPKIDVAQIVKEVAAAGWVEGRENKDVKRAVVQNLHADTAQKAADADYTRAEADEKRAEVRMKEREQEIELERLKAERGRQAVEYSKNVAQAIEHCKELIESSPARLAEYKAAGMTIEAAATLEEKNLAPAHQAITTLAMVAQKPPLAIEASRASQKTT